MNMLIKNCRIIDAETDNKEHITDILIEDGKVKSIKKDINVDSENIIDADGNYVIPGVIDPHVHFREPGLTHKEDFHSGSIAAASGGITTIIDMPNTKPPTFMIKDLEEKKILAESSIVNYGLYIGASADNNVEEIKKAQALSYVPGTKLFMNLSTGKLLVEDKELILSIFNASKFVAVHAEGDKVEEAIKYSIETQTPLYLCHISMRHDIETIKKYRNENGWAKDNVYVEVTPHHLFLTEDNYKKDGAYCHMIPNLKTKDDQKALWEAIAEGIVDTIGTDHAPHTIEEKDGENAPAGVPGVETLLPLMLNAVNEGRLKLERLIELTSTNAARLFGMRNKGIIKEGYDADLTIIDLDSENVVVNDDLNTRCGWSPFNDMGLKGWPIMTIINGNLVYDYGKVIEYPGKAIEFVR